MEESSLRVSLEKVDQARAWMCYAAFSGDVEKAALASKVSATAVRALEHDFGWAAKLKRLKTGAGESDAERVANRAVNYLQAQRMRDVLDKALRLLDDEEELVKALVKFKFSQDGDVEKIEVNPKAILDLAKALEAAQNMSYRALGDRLATTAQGVDGSEKGGTTAAGVANVRGVIEALSELREQSERVANAARSAASDTPPRIEEPTTLDAEEVAS
jgi:hypothetical protein